MSEDTPGVVEGIATPISTEQPNDTVPAADTAHPAEMPSTEQDVVAGVVAALRPALERLNRDVENLYATLGLRRPE